MKTLLLAVAVLLSAGAVQGRPPVLSGSKQVSESAIVNVERAVGSLDFKTWHIIVLPENTYAKLCASNIGIDRYVKSYKTAFSTLNGVTYVNEIYAKKATIERLHHTLAHELGHLTCRCEDEHEAEAFAESH